MMAAPHGSPRSTRHRSGRCDGQRPGCVAVWLCAGLPPPRHPGRRLSAVSWASSIQTPFGGESQFVPTLGLVSGPCAPMGTTEGFIPGTQSRGGMSPCLGPGGHLPAARRPVRGLTGLAPGSGRKSRARSVPLAHEEGEVVETWDLLGPTSVRGSWPFPEAQLGAGHSSGSPCLRRFQPLPWGLQTHVAPSGPDPSCPLSPSLGPAHGLLPSECCARLSRPWTRPPRPSA